MSVIKQLYMKLLSTLSVIILLISSCDKKDTADRGLSGTWRLVEIRGMFPTTDIPDAAKETLTFDGDKYTMNIGDTMMSGTFTTAEDGSVEKEVCLRMEPGRYTRIIIYAERSSDQKIFYEFSGDTLKTISGCHAYDAGVEKIYKRGVVN